MAAEFWTLDSTNKFKWQAKARNLVQGLIRKTLLSKMAHDPTAYPMNSAEPSTKSSRKNGMQASDHSPPCAHQGDTLDCGVCVVAFVFRWLRHTKGCQTGVQNHSDLEKLHLTSHVNGRLWRRLIVLMNSASRLYGACYQELQEDQWSQQQHTVLEESDKQADERLPHEFPFPTASAVLNAINDVRARLESQKRCQGDTGTAHQGPRFVRGRPRAHRTERAAGAGRVHGAAHQCHERQERDIHRLLTLLRHRCRGGGPGAGNTCRACAATVLGAPPRRGATH